MRRTVSPVGLLLALTLALAGCGVFGGASDGRTTIELFQFKPEAIQSFNRIIAAFERENPTIRVQQNHVPDADTQRWVISGVMRGSIK